MTYAHVIGDLRVAGADGPIDGFGVAKVRGLASNTLIGFAGSVPIGLNLIAAMQHSFSSTILVSTFDNNSSIREALPMRLWIDTWRKVLEETYSEVFPSERRDDGLELLIVNVSGDREFPHLPRPRGWILDLPRPGEESVDISEYFPPLRTVFSIGSGADHDRLVEALQAAASNLPTSGRFTTSTDPMRQPADSSGLFIEKRLQETVRELLGASDDVGPILVSSVVNVNRTRNMTWNNLSSLPPILGTWPEVANALRRTRTAGGALDLSELTSPGEFLSDDQWAARTISLLIAAFDKRLRSQTEEIRDLPGGTKVTLPVGLSRIPPIEGFLVSKYTDGCEFRFLISAAPEDAANGITYRGSEPFELTRSQMQNLIAALNQSL